MTKTNGIAASSLDEIKKSVVLRMRSAILNALASVWSDKWSLSVETEDGLINDREFTVKISVKNPDTPLGHFKELRCELADEDEQNRLIQRVARGYYLLICNPQPDTA